MSPLENVYPRQFYDRYTPDVARELIGVVLCRRLPDGQVLRARIVEVEAYRDNEPACHAARGVTPRCAVMFGPPGVSYVYFIYGSCHCLNVVTEGVGNGCAVLIRALEGDGTNGPGKLCRQWDIDKSHNGIDMTDPKSDLWICKPEVPVKASQVGVSERIGIKVATDLRWRFFLKGHKDVSGPKYLNCGEKMRVKPAPPAVARQRRARVAARSGR